MNLSDCQMTGKGSNLDSNLNSSAWPTSCEGFFCPQNPWINCVEFESFLRSVEDAEIDWSSELFLALFSQTAENHGGLIHLKLPRSVRCLELERGRSLKLGSKCFFRNFKWSFGCFKSWSKIWAHRDLSEAERLLNRKFLLHQSESSNSMWFIDQHW